MTKHDERKAFYAMARCINSLRRWYQERQVQAQLRHEQALAAQYSPRLSAYRQIVAAAIPKPKKVIPFLNLQVSRDKRIRRIA